MGLIDRLGAGPVALDTVCFIYFIEDHPRYCPIIEPLFADVNSGRLRAVTSAITLLEVLVVPYRAGDLPLAERYELLLSRSRGLDLVAIDTPLLRAAAKLRATIGLRTPDALQLTAGLAARAGTFVTNDRDLPTAVAGMQVVQLSSLV